MPPKKWPTMWVKCPPRREGQPGKTICRKPWARNRQFTETPEEVEISPKTKTALLRLLKQGSLVEIPPPDVATAAQPMTAQPIEDLPPAPEPTED